jgi:fimbrial isopeptide formation D2 family protein/uncharacterized repeat protein (TIGR01451 family)
MRKKIISIVSLIVGLLMISSIITMGAGIDFNFTRDNTSATTNITSCNDPTFNTPTITLVDDGSIGQVIKKIWNNDTSQWVDSINAMIDDIITFNITIIYEPELFNSTVVYDLILNDTLPSCLEYSNNAIVIYGDSEIPGESYINGNQIFWNLSEEPFNVKLWNTSKPGHELDEDRVTILYNATVVDYTTQNGQKNNAQIRGYETCPHRYLFGDDNATIIVEGQVDQPCIEIIKQVKNGNNWDDNVTVNIGENVEFKLTINNCGNVDLTEVFVNDVLPDFLVYNYDANPTHLTASDHNIEWYYDIIPISGSEIITFSANANETGEGYNIVNVITCEQVSDQAQAYVKVINYSANFTCEKLVWDENSDEWVDLTNAMINDTVRFKLIVEYEGDFILYNILIKDILSDCFEYANNATMNGTSYEPDIIDIANNTLIWDVDLLGSGENITIEFDAVIKSSDSCVNTMEVTANECGSDILYCDDTATVIIDYVPLFNCEKLVWNDDTSQWVNLLNTGLNQIVRFKINISYEGDYLLYNMTVTDELPDCFEYMNNATMNGNSSEPIYDEINNTLKWNPPIIGSGESIEIEFDAKTLSYGECINTVNITTNECSGLILFCEDSAIVNVLEGPSIECEKLVWDDTTDQWVDYLSVEVGEIVRFNITVTYLGQIALYNIWILDNLEECLEYGNNAYPEEPTINGTQLLWFFEVALEYGESVSVEFDAKVDAAGDCINSANITANECNYGNLLYCDDSIIINGIASDLEADAGGPYSGYVDDTINIYGSASGGTSPYNFSWDLDNDFTYGDDYGNSIQNSWSTAGTYTIRLRVTDDNNITSTDTAQVIITQENTKPNKPSTPTGSTDGKSGDEYTYSTSTTDPEGDQVYYLFDWGDGTNSGWLGPFNSGITIEDSHIWEERGDYEIKVRAKDTGGLLSDWSDPLPISMPLIKRPKTIIIEFIERLIEQFPILQWILSLPFFNK